MNLKVNSLRASVFFDKTVITPERLWSIGKLFEDEGFLFTYNANAMGNGVFISGDNTKTIALTQMQLDIFFNKCLDEEAFCKCAVDYIVRLQEFTGDSIIRLAYAPTYLLSDIDVSIANSFFCKQKFKDSKIEEFAFSNTFFIDEEINNKHFLINYLSSITYFDNFSYDSNLNQISQKCIGIQMDINTSNKQDYIFTQEDYIDFFKKAPDFSAEYLDFYKEKKN